MVENGYPEQTLKLAKEEIEQPQSENPATAAEVVSEPEDEVSLPDGSDTTVILVKLDKALENIHLSPTPDKDEYSTITSITVEEDQIEENLNSSTAVSSESNELEVGQSLQNPSTSEVPTTLENPSSSGSNDSASDPSSLPSEALEQEKRDPTTPAKMFSALLERVKRFILGGQPYINNAVAMIETPMRIQPNKDYTIRIHLIGRNEPKHVQGFKQGNEGTGQGGLGSLIHGELVHIEVRSALYHNYAYIVQQVDVRLPASNYAAEITIPMRSITDGSGTKRERLHIFFTDEKQKPLYEKPFLIELFISNLVQSGQEGHNVLSIPL